jgi:NADPH2:quinone reductase
VILYNDQDFLEETTKITGGKGVDVAYDAVGKATWEGSLKSVKPRGLLVLYGNASGPTPPIAPLTLTAQGSIFMTRPSLVHHIATREELEWRAGDILGWAADGSLDVYIGGEYPLEAAAQAQIDLASRKTSGKLLLNP